MFLNVSTHFLQICWALRVVNKKEIVFQNVFVKRAVNYKPFIAGHSHGSLTFTRICVSEPLQNSAWLKVVLQGFPGQLLSVWK